MILLDKIEESDFQDIVIPTVIDNCKLRESAQKGSEITDEIWSCVNKENRDIVTEFIQNNPQWSDKTAIQYKSALRIFFHWNYLDNNDKPLYKISKRDYLKYQSWLIERNFSSSALKFKKSTISSLCNYIESVVADDDDNYKYFKNFCRGLPALPKNKVYEKKPLNREEYEKLVDYLMAKQSWQKLAYLEFSYASACRKNEARQLLKTVVDNKPIVKGTDENTFIFYMTHKIKCKGSKRNEDKIRPLTFDETAMNAMKQWLSFRGEDDCQFMFVTKVGRKYREASESAFNTWTDEFSEVIGRRIHPHLIRSSKATIMSQEDGKNIKTIQKLLGHNDSSTTELYIIRNEEDDLDDIYA